MRSRLFSLFILALVFVFVFLPVSASVGMLPAAPDDFLQYYKTYYHDRGLNFPISVAVSPDSAHIYVATFYDDSITAFSQDVVSGKLVPVGMGRQ
ncbi:hypothetical protein ACFLZW_01975 [Chloroflexota bacterium]